VEKEQVITPLIKQVTQGLSEAQPNRSDSDPNDEDHSREARPRRRIDMAKPQPADCHLFASRVNKSQTASGNLTYGKEIFDTLQVNGFLTLNGTTILQRLEVNGNLTASVAQIGELQVKGQAILSHSTVKDKCAVTGAIKAAFSTFEKEITLTSNHSTFDECKITAIQVKKTRDFVTQMIELKGKTEVTDLITFESGRGQVNASPDNNIKASQVIGGKLNRL